MQPRGSRPAIPAAPNLILLPSGASLDASDAQVRDGDPSVLGLTLTRRTIMAARRAGYGQIFFLARDRAAPPGTTMIVDWRRLADALLPSQTASLVSAPPTIPSETVWLKGLAATQIEPAAWAAIPDRIIVLAATAVPDALAVLHAEGGASDLSAVQERLPRRVGSAAAGAVEIDPVVVATVVYIAGAERRLLIGLVRHAHGFMLSHFAQFLSLRCSRR